MTTQEKAEAILKKIVEEINQGHAVAFEDDFGGNTLTVYVDGAHTHCGVPNGTWDQLVESLYNSMSGGPGLSWHDPKLE